MKRAPFKEELHTNYIFLYFTFIGLELDSITLFTKMNFFTSKTHISTSFTHAFYLLTWTCFNDVNMGKSILINSQLMNAFFMSSDKKKLNKIEKDKKTWKRKKHHWKWYQWKRDTRFKFFEAFLIWTKNKHRIY